VPRRADITSLVSGACIAALGVLLLLEMLMASRGWRGVANPLTTVPPTGAGS
jgi:hypothetical protein